MLILVGKEISLRVADEASRLSETHCLVGRVSQLPRSRREESKRKVATKCYTGESTGVWSLSLVQSLSIWDGNQTLGIFSKDFMIKRVHPSFYPWDLLNTIVTLWAITVANETLVKTHSA